MSGGQRLSFQGSLRWAAGDGGTKQLLLGSCVPNADQSGALNLLRVGYHGDAPGERATAVVKLGDLGTLLGPIDLPFAIVAEGPFDIAVTPEGARSGSLNVILSTREVCAFNAADSYATHSIVADLNEVIALPQWVRSVSALAGATFQFRDRASASLDANLTGKHDRPALASEVLVTTAGTIVLFY